MPSTIKIDKATRIKDLIADLNSDDNTYVIGAGQKKTTREAFIDNPKMVLNSYGITIHADPNYPTDLWLEEEIEEIRNIIGKINDIKIKFPPIPNTIKDLREPKGKAGVVLPDDDDLLIS